MICIFCVNTTVRDMLSAENLNSKTFTVMVHRAVAVEVFFIFMSELMVEVCDASDGFC